MTATYNKRKDDAQLAVMARDIQYLIEKMEGIEKNTESVSRKVDEQFVTKIEFDPYKQIIKAVVGFILLSFMGGLASLVILNAK